MYNGIGLGTFPFANPFTQVGSDGAHEVLDAYFEAGGEYLDTAPTYAFGQVEELLGEYLTDKPRESFAISTSCGYVRDGEGFKVSGKYDDVRKDAEESLERLRLDHFDIYISHIPDLGTPYEETAAALQALKDEGIARAIGVSNVSADQLRRYGSAADISVVQNRLSYLNRTLEPAITAELAQQGAAVVAYQVLERGLLTGRGVADLADTDLRQRKPEFKPERVAWVRSLVEGGLSRIAAAAELSVEQLVVRWTLAQDNVGLAQMGATNRDQAARIPGYGGSLSAETLAELEELYRNAESDVIAKGSTSVVDFLGLATYDVRSGSASGS
ncbi:aldo/keto reductase [Umezawaea endophytica]|uniref:Aldo/keto reductase n=1 Tax=Umezawaea endophytica TaxID=1654476 RepID=A0A9X2VM89_9PSEU|nr:aldo/keto reductase [Umezawaea endophytica]MCS7479112.1 aldo/keto reductase [Umezawaea endophytica]